METEANVSGVAFKAPDASNSPRATNDAHNDTRNARQTQPAN